MLSHAMGAESQIVVRHLVLLRLAAGLEAQMLLLGTLLLSLPERAECEMLDWQRPLLGLQKKVESDMQSWQGILLSHAWVPKPEVLQSERLLIDLAEGIQESCLGCERLQQVIDADEAEHELPIRRRLFPTLAARANVQMLG